MTILLCLWLGLAVGAEAAPNSLAYQRYSRGVELATKKKWDAALQQFQEAIDLNPQYAASYVEWARAAVMMGRRKDALAKITAGLAFARGSEERKRLARERDSLADIFYTNETFQRYQNGLNYLKLDRPASAVEQMELALKTEPDNVAILAAYAQALQAEERTKEALSALERAHALHEGNVAVRTELAEATLTQNPERAQQLIRPLLAEAFEERVALIQAQALSALRKNKEALEFLRQQMERKPAWIFVPYWLGKLYSLEADGGWNARKFLMTFLKRTEAESEKEGALATAEGRRLKATRAEAEAILTRVNKLLE